MTLLDVAPKFKLQKAYSHDDRVWKDFSPTPSPLYLQQNRHGDEKGMETIEDNKQIKKRGEKRGYT